MEAGFYSHTMTVVKQSYLVGVRERAQDSQVDRMEISIRKDGDQPRLYRRREIRKIAVNRQIVGGS